MLCCLEHMYGQYLFDEKEYSTTMDDNSPSIPLHQVTNYWNHLQ